MADAMEAKGHPEAGKFREAREEFRILKSSQRPPKKRRKSSHFDPTNYHY